jgi:hypothetical protein
MSLVTVVKKIEIAVENAENKVETFIVDIIDIAEGKTPPPTGNTKADKVINLVQDLAVIYGDVEKVLALPEVKALLKVIEAL